MRPVILADLDAAARRLAALPEPLRPARARQVIARAESADRFRRRTGRLHPAGDGTLMAAAMAILPPPLPRSRGADAAYLASLAIILAALAAHRKA